MTGDGGDGTKSQPSAAGAFGKDVARHLPPGLPGESSFLARPANKDEGRRGCTPCGDMRKPLDTAAQFRYLLSGGIAFPPGKPLPGACSREAGNSAASVFVSFSPVPPGMVIRMKMSLTGKLLAMLLALVLLLGTIPVSAAGAASETEDLQADTQAAGSGFTEVELLGSNADNLKSYLEMDGNYIIKINRDMDSDYADTGNWCTLGSGVKVLNLNGHEVTVHNDEDYSHSQKAFSRFYGDRCTMLSIPEGAELVINDDGNSGAIEYACYLDTSYYGGRHMYFEQRDLIEVNGGKLTVNGGNFHAGRSKKYYSYHDAENVWAQVNGHAVWLIGGTVVINGGSFAGRGYKNYSFDAGEFVNYYLDIAKYVGCAAITAESGDLTIYDGEFRGNGSADVMQITSKVNISIYGGIFESNKLGCPIAFYQINESGDTISTSPSYGYIGIPGRAFKNIGTKTQVYKKDDGFLTAEQLAADATLKTVKYVVVQPIEQQTGDMLKYDGASFRPIGQNVTVEWDKVSSLRFRLVHDPYYPTLRSYDTVEEHDVGNTYAAICTSPNSDNWVPALNMASGTSWVDLDDLPQSSKDKLAVGTTYYVRMGDFEVWKSTSTRHTIRYSDDRLLKIKIVEPELKMPELNLEIEYEPELDGAGDNITRVSAAGDGSTNALYKRYLAGEISKFTTKWTYYDKSGAQKTKTNDGTYTGDLYFYDFYRGISTVKYEVSLYKGDVLLGTKSVSRKVVFFPDLAADKTVDSSGRILLEASATDKKVTLSCDANSYTGIFWTRNNEKISGSEGKKTWTVDLSTAKSFGWYGIGYTVDGTDRKSDQTIYLGVKDGERSISVTASGTECTVKQDGDSTPTFTAKVSGSGWGTNKKYQWKNVSWPEGTEPNTRYVGNSTSATTNTISLAKLFGVTGVETRLAEGTYCVSCTVYDLDYDNAVTSVVLTVKVYRPAQGLEIWQDVEADRVDSVNVTDGFVVLDGVGGTAVIRGVFTPQNAKTGTVTYSSYGTGTATVSSEGGITGKAPGMTTVQAKSGSLSATTKVLVPRTKYSITIPEEWLNVKAGETVHRGAIPGTFQGCTAELVWNTVGTFSNSEYTADTFVGDLNYFPTVRIYPNSGVCYPVDIDYFYANSGRIDYDVDPERFEITVNDVTYFGAYCGRTTFYDTEPVSAGDKSEDFIDLDMDPTGKIIDWRDEYISYVLFSVDTPFAGDPKDVTGEGDSVQLDYSVATDGITVGSDSVYRVTDLSTIKDKDPGNDALEEDFTAYELGETYRAQIYLLVDRYYKTPAGGTAHFADTVVAVEPELGAITRVQYSLVYAYVYFTVTEERKEPPKVIFTGGSFDEKLTVSLEKSEDLEGPVYLIAAAYDDKGRMLGAERLEASFTDNKAEETFTFKAVTGKIARARVYALDADSRPLAVPYGFTVGL